MGNESCKRLAAEEALKLVDSGITLGLGTGTTMGYFLELLGERLRQGELKGIRAVTTSAAEEYRARQLGIPLCELDAGLTLDLTVDGADEVDLNLNLIKGAGGALLREKIVAEASHRYVIIADETKLSTHLGAKRPVPVEVVMFGWQRVDAYFRSLCGNVSLRKGPVGESFVTSGGNFILDCHFFPVDGRLADQIKCHTGVVEHGIFLNTATEAIIAGKEGIRRLKRKASHDRVLVARG